MNKKEIMYEKIRKHGEVIIQYFGLDEDPVILCKKLRRLEIVSNRVMVDYCNGDINYEELESILIDTIKPKLEKIFGKTGTQSIYINQDPRGYTLKLNEIESKRIEGHKDWGGYFILAPDFKGD